MVSWFAHNPIAANLLMLLIIAGGLTGIPALDKKYFPDFESDVVSVSVPYPGAGPREVEEQICIRIEEAIHDLNGIKEIRSSARQNMGTVMVEAELGYDSQRLTSEIKTRVDAITSFPVEVERPVVSEVAFRNEMMTLTIAADIGEDNLKRLGEELRDEMSTLPYVSVVDLKSPRPYEVSVEVSEYTLRRYGLRFEDVVNAIRASSLNLPAGSIKDEGGDIQLQTRGQAYQRSDFEQIALVGKRDGTRLLLGDIATIVDGFADEDTTTRFNGKPSLDLEVYVTSSPDVLQTNQSVTRWLEEAQSRLPEGVELVMWKNQTVPFKSRVETLLNNGVGGLVLVYILLLIFLRPLLAMWVCVGIAVAFLGSFWLLQYTGVSLNMISLFAFLLILGIVVDDAIIVGESIHAHQSSGKPGLPGAVLGAQGVLKPVMFAVISTMIFFAPMLFLPGEMARVSASIPVVVILALFFSLVECLLILPAHLAHMSPVKPLRNPHLARLEILRERAADSMLWFAEHKYRPFLARCLDSYLLTLSLFFMVLLFSLSLYAGGWMKAGFFPKVLSDWVIADVSLQEGGAYNRSLEVQQQVEAAAERTRERFNSDERFENYAGDIVGHVYSSSTNNQVVALLELGDTDIDAEEISNAWREEIGDIGEYEQFNLRYTFNHIGKPIRLLLSAPEFETLDQVSALVVAELERYPGVYNIRDSFQSPKDEIELDLKPAAENLGITLADLATQVRRAFYGAEAQRIPRTREDVKVMVRYPEDERISIDNLNEMRIRTPMGTEVPFETVAEVRFVPGYLTIDRLDRKRTLEVSADVVMGTSNPAEVINNILLQQLPDWRSQYPGLNIALEGELREESEFLNAMIRYMGLSMLIIYGLMAIPFRSYWQPFIILTAVPFGIMGAIFGHLILDWQVSMMSMLGVLACAGVVVNDNLVLIDRINQLRASGLAARDALLQAGQDRFRPIILTSITTFIGLLPIMSETSPQAAFLIPMVISLAFRVLFATGVTLLLVPSLYLFGERFGAKVTASRDAATVARESA